VEYHALADDRELLAILAGNTRRGLAQDLLELHGLKL